MQAFKALIALVFAGTLTACTQPSAQQEANREIFDPYENVNRGVHSLNRGIDKVIFRPASKGYVTVIPEPMVESFSHFADNLSMPSNAVNALLQGDMKGVGDAVARFVINTTIGFAGLADPASEFGLANADTDFGETLHAWGFKEGAYIELPLLGPSTERDAVGTVVDFFTNPIEYATHNPLKNGGVYAEIVQRMGNRGRYSDTVDSILYESADSYAQARVIYLQNRRFELGGEAGQDYSDPYADPYSDPYEDPYE